MGQNSLSVAGAIQRQLLTWFRRHQRDLPWRCSRDPYRIWVSEVMLQQTQVATVIPYFEQFLARFPTVAVLAAAAEQEVLRLWEGMGYYRRARHLHQAARLVVTHHGGELPEDAATLRKLPGIGRYMAGAILSQAFDQRLPIVEANSQRVMCRLLGRRAALQLPATQRWLWKTAEQLLPAKHAGDFNQALMELGALVCTPGTPRCNQCPVSASCEAKRRGLQDRIPVRRKPPDPVEVQEVAVVVHRAGKVLLVQRPRTGRWSQMWEFPHQEVKQIPVNKKTALRALKQLTGIEAVINGHLHTVRHGVTHHRITMQCYEGSYRRGRFCSKFYQDGKWFLVKDLHCMPVSAPQRRLIEALQ